MSGALIGLLLLVACYLLTLSRRDPWDIALAALLATGLWLLARAYLRTPDPDERHRTADTATAPPLPARLLGVVPFCLAVAWDVTIGTGRVALVVLGLRPMPPTGIVAVPIGERTPAGVAVSALCTTLSPGTCLIDIDWERRVMLLHVLDARDPDAVRDAHQHFYDRYQRRVFP